MTRKTYRSTEVFVPGGAPEYTYVPRTAVAIEQRLRAASENLCKLVTLTGATKSGKTVVTRRIYPRNTSVWIDGGGVDAEDDIWTEVIDQLGGFTGIEHTRSAGTGLSGKASAEAEGNLFVAKGKGGASLGANLNWEGGVARQRDRALKPAALDTLRQSGRALIIDDFHYLERDIQRSVVRAIKALVFDGHPVIVIAIPHRRYDAARVEKEMASRLESIDVPAWSPSELVEIPNVGFDLLKVVVPGWVTDSMVKESLGSPHLIQDFCRTLCDHHGVAETKPKRIKLDIRELEPVYRRVAEMTGRVIFDAMAKGPRQRSDRKMRMLKEGGKDDIYGVVLRAIASIGPGVDKLDYEEKLRPAIRSVLGEDPPQGHEVSRVLDQMSQISAADEASAPVIDWDSENRYLHITDPYFAFYLKWGNIDH